MSQHDYVLDNQPGLSFRTDLNNALAAIASLNSGATAPSTTYANMLWADTMNSQLKMRNAANNAWIVVGTISGSSFVSSAITTPGGWTITDDGSGGLTFIVGGVAKMTLSSSGVLTTASTINSAGTP